MLGVKIVHGLPVCIHSDREHLEFSVLQSVIQLLDLRRFLDAGTTPGRPEVQKYNLAPIIAKFDGLATLIFYREIRSHLADVDNAGSADAGRFFINKIAGNRS